MIPGVCRSSAAPPGKNHRNSDNRSPHDLVRADTVGQDGGTSLDRLERGPAVALKEFFGLRLEARIVEALVVEMSVHAVNHGAVNSKWLDTARRLGDAPVPPSGKRGLRAQARRKEGTETRKRPKTC
jgi:hypothetical protein